MTSAESIYLAVVIGAFAAFALSLAFASRSKE